MDEIWELQQQLAAAQKGSSSQKLAERNCVELVMKLQSMKLIDLIFTKSGKEYLTHEQLVLEIQDELMVRGGRVNIIDLPEALNIDLVHIQSKLPGIVDAAEGSTRLVRGELLTDYYLASLAEEINDTLTSSEHGLDNVGAIASRYGLTVDVAREIVLTHQGSIINASVDAQNPDVLRSVASIARDRAAARGLLRATTAPTGIADLARLRGLPVALVAVLVEDMLEEGSLAGSRVGRGARAVFVPAVFAKAAVQAATSAFASNGFITMERLSNIHITDVGSFVYEHIRGAVVLNSCIVGPTFIETLATSATEAVAGDNWLDIDVSLPPSFPTDDVAAVMSRVMQSVQHESQGPELAIKPEIVRSSRTRRKSKSAANSSGSGGAEKASLVFGNRYIVSPSLVKALHESLELDALGKAKDRARLMTEKMDTVGSQVGAEAPLAVPETRAAESGKKSKGKGRRRAGAKDKGKASTANGSTGSTNGMDSEFPISKPSVDEALEIILSDDQWASVVETDYLGSSAAGDEMTACLLEETYGEDGLVSLYQTKAEEAVASLVRERALAKKNAEKALLTGLEEAELYYKSASTLPEEELVAASRSWVMDDICVNILCRVIDAVAQGIGIVEVGIGKAHELSSKRGKLDMIRAVLPKLAPVLETKLRAFVTVVSDKDGGKVEEFLRLYDENSRILDLPERRPLDKKGEKMACANLRAKLSLSLDSCTMEAQCLHVAAVLVHTKSNSGMIVSFPLEATIGFCTAIEEDARPAETGAALRDLRECMSMEKEANEPDVADALSADFAEKLRVLREYIG